MQASLKNFLDSTTIKVPELNIMNQIRADVIHENDNIKMNDVLLGVGLTATLFSSTVLLPQVYTTFKTKNIKGLSTTAFIISLFGSVLWLAYGSIDIDYPIIVSSCINLIASISLLIMIYVFSKNKQK